VGFVLDLKGEIRINKESTMQGCSQKKKRKGFTLLEILVVIAIVSTIIVISFVTLRNARINANESTAQASLNTFRQAMEQYRIIFTTYPVQLTDLSGSNPPFCDAGLTDGSWAGYNFALSNASAFTYTITAVPQQLNLTGKKTFRITEAGEIFQVAGP